MDPIIALTLGKNVVDLIIQLLQNHGGAQGAAAAADIQKQVDDNLARSDANADQVIERAKGEIGGE